MAKQFTLAALALIAGISTITTAYADDSSADTSEPTDTSEPDERSETQKRLDELANEVVPEPVRLTQHGFRIGYTYVNADVESSPLRSRHLFVIGYEATQRVLGGDWLNVIVVENVSVSGINQSLFIPSMSGLVGFEIREQLQVGTGVNLMPFDPSGQYIHQVIAVGWTPKAGAFRVPIHMTYIPDVRGNYRIGATIGVNW